MPKTNKNLNISFWDKITDFTKIISLSESLKFIEKVDGKLDYDSIYFTVNGIEDEGVLLGNDGCTCGRKGTYFKVLGRIQNAEVRGCSDTYTQ